MLEIGIGIPFYNDSRIIRKTIKSLEEIDARLSNHYIVKFLFWDDGSKKDEGEILDLALHSSSSLAGKSFRIRTKSNFGYGYATYGIKNYFSNMDFCVILDSELSMTQDDVIEIVDYYSKAIEGSLNFNLENGLIIKASRFSTASGLADLRGIRKFWTILGNLFAKFTLGGSGDPTNGFRGLDRKAMEILLKCNSYENGFASIVEEMYLARIKKISISNSNQIYISRNSDSRPTTFVYLPRVLWSYIRICLFSATYRLTRFIPKLYK